MKINQTPKMVNFDCLKLNIIKKFYHD